MDYRDDNSKKRTTSGSQNARKRIMSPQEIAQRDQLFSNRDKLHQRQESEGLDRLEQPSKRLKVPRNKKKKVVLEGFHLGAGFLGLIIVLMSLNLLTFVQGIQVKNNVNATAKDIVAWATEDTFSFNGMYLWYKINHTEIEYPVSIVDAKVSFQNPWTLTLSVTEKEILGGIVLSDGYAYFDQDGQVLLVTKSIQEGISLVRGVQVSETELYEPLGVKNQDGFQNLLVVMQLIEKHQVIVDQIIPNNDSSISLKIGDTTVRLGVSDYEAKVTHILPILERLEEKEGTLYLENFDGDNGTITFK